MEDRLRRLLDETPGPAPWYRRALPSFCAGDRTWSWRLEPPDDELRGWPVLQSDWDGEIRFVPSWYAYASAAGAGRMLVWRARPSGSIEIRVYGIDAMPPVRFARPDPSARDLCAVPPVEALDIPRLPAGNHDGFSSGTAVLPEEILLLAARSPGRDDQPALAIYAWSPTTGRVTVLPQTWFTGASHDLGYDWVTRIARDPETSHIVGEGIRIPPFELEDDGMTLRRLLAPEDA